MCIYIIIKKHVCVYIYIYMYVYGDYLDKYISVVTWLPKQKFLARLVSKPKVLIRPYWRMLSNNFFQRGHVIQ